MTKKELFKSEILMEMKIFLDASALAILDSVLSDALYKVDTQTSHIDFSYAP